MGVFLNKYGKTICNLKNDFLSLTNFVFVALLKSQKNGFTTNYRYFVNWVQKVMHQI